MDLLHLMNIPEHKLQNNVKNNLKTKSYPVNNCSRQLVHSLRLVGGMLVL